MSPGKKPSRSPASTAGRDRMMRSTSLRSNIWIACATASQVLPVPAGPVPNTSEWRLERADVGILRGGAGAHRPLAQIDFLEGRARAGRIEIEQRALRDRLPDGAFDVAGRQILAALDLFVETFEHAAGLFAGVARAFDVDVIAALVGHDAKPAFDQSEVLAVLAEQHRSQPVVLESEHDLCRGSFFRSAAGGITGSDVRKVCSKLLLRCQARGFADGLGQCAEQRIGSDIRDRDFHDRTDQFRCAP